MSAKNVMQEIQVCKFAKKEFSIKNWWGGVERRVDDTIRPAVCLVFNQEMILDPLNVFVFHPFWFQSLHHKTDSVTLCAFNSTF